MKKTSIKLIFTKSAAIILSVCFLLLSVPVAGAETIKLGTVNTSVLNFRTDAGTEFPIIEQLFEGRVLTILGEKRDGAGGLWYKASLFDNPDSVGYVHSDYILVSEVDSGGPGETDEFEAYLDSEGFPESYRPSLRLLHAMYPKWVFKAVKTGLSWETVLYNESLIGRNLVPSSSNPLWINKSDVDSNGNQIGRDGPNWVSASRDIVAYYLDPRNFLNLSYIFQFESLSYIDGVHTTDGTNNILSGTFMNSSNTVIYDGKTYTYAEIFQAAAASSGASPYHLASRARQEQGNYGTTLSNGTVPGYEGYFNFFNINAYTTDEHSAVTNGAIYAKSQGWSSPYLSILHGSGFIAKAYIAKGQDTLYFQKFNVVNKSDGLFYHQYMTNVMAPASEAGTMRNAYSSYDLPIAFKIPVYTGMPEQPVEKPTEAVVPGLKLDGCAITSDTYISGCKNGTDVSSILAGATVTNRGSVKITNASGTVKASGAVATGDKLNLYYSNGSLYRSYTFIVVGDTNGDSKISLPDLLQIQKYLLDISYVSHERFYASDINNDGKISLVDLLAVQKHLLGISSIAR